jgi:hypothetical protein
MTIYIYSISLIAFTRLVNTSFKKFFTYIIYKPPENPGAFFRYSVADAEEEEGSTTFSVMAVQSGRIMPR